MNFPKFMSNPNAKHAGDNMAEITAPPLPVRQQPRPYSEVAARAAQHVHDLEMTIEAQQAEIHALTARLTVADERARVVQQENEFLMRDRDYHKERCVKIETKLNSAAQLILDCMDSTAKKQEQPLLTESDLARDMTLPEPVTVSDNTTYDPSMQSTNIEPKKNGKRKNGDNVNAAE